jgi:hypothetical protein
MTVLVALALFVQGCGRSVLIHRDDVTYRRALDCFKRTRLLVTASLAPEDDQAIFIQAEALFRYRFAPPGRSVSSYVAQITASIIDLPVLDSLAGSLDLDLLRLRTSDGAVQLWESLLARNPSTPLRPLTLYRLGWAYRNSIASDFPGTSENAFDEIIAKHHDSPVAPFAAEARTVAWKSQRAATAWSIVPGLGQMYVGEHGNGTIRLAIALAAMTMIIVPSVIAFERRNDLSWHHDWPLILTGVAGVTVLTSDYSSSYQDAQRAVLEFNERSEAEFETSHPTAP